VSVWPSGDSNVSNRTATGQTIPNLAIVKIGANGAIRFANFVGSVDVIVDVVGYFDPTGGSRFHAINPTRVLDSRVPTGLSGPWGPGITRVLGVAGGHERPASATGLVANVTATAGTAGSSSRCPRQVAVPNSSNVNFGAGETIPNLHGQDRLRQCVAFFNKLGSVHSSPTPSATTPHLPPADHRPSSPPRPATAGPEMRGLGRFLRRLCASRFRRMFGGVGAVIRAW
jgi:hypothetical protein